MASNTAPFEFTTHSGRADILRQKSVSGNYFTNLAHGKGVQQSVDFPDLNAPFVIAKYETCVSRR